MRDLAPVTTTLANLGPVLRARGYAVLAPRDLEAVAAVTIDELDLLAPYWNDLVADAYLRDGGRYRRRRHACYVIEDGEIAPVPRRAHWQPIDYNALHGGIERWFEPVTEALASNRAWTRLLIGLAACFDTLRKPPRWHVEAHAFRIDTEGGIGRPTPEGAHRDGVDFVAVILVARLGIKGGETRVFETEGTHGERFTMLEPWTALLLDDERVVHETTPIQPVVNHGHRDTLVLTYRANGFQAPDSSSST